MAPLDTPLPALGGELYATGEKLLGVALSALMRLPAENSAWKTDDASPSTAARKTGSRTGTGEVETA
jgi:hypothetical protein